MQQAKTKGTAKSEAQAAKRARQKQEQAALGVGAAQLNMGKACVTNMRTAQKLCTICPNAVTTRDPDALQHNFDLEVVTDHRWGLYVQTQPTKRIPAPNRVAVRYSSPQQRMGRAELLAA